MPYRLRDGLSYCHSGDHFVFLDLANDRYFELPPSLQDVFHAHIEDRSGRGAGIDISGLLRHDILTVASANEPSTPPSIVGLPRYSAIEQSSSNQKPGIVVLLEVSAIVCWTQFRLKTGKISGIARDLVVLRQRRTPPSHDGLDAPTLQRVLESADSFRRARPYVPVETCCLLDALSMVSFLSRRRLPSYVVFGITHDPFAAHCWVQVDDIVLNDTVGNVSRHTPIRTL